MKNLSKAGLLCAVAAGAMFAAAGAHANTLVIAEQQTPEGFDGDALRPRTQHVVVQIYENLVRYARVEEDGRTVLNPDDVEPHLAESWTVSDDGMTWVFKLREGVLSPFGNELTADDVVWGWEKSFDQRRTGNFIANVANVAGVRALSEYEVEFTLSAPSSIFLQALTLYIPGIYDTTEVKQHATDDDPWALEWMESNTAGFGAYHLQTLRPGERAVFVANPNYFLGQPYFTEVIFTEVPSEAARSTLLKAGQVQWIDRPSIQMTLDLQRDPNVKVDRFTGRSMAAVRMNPKCEPFDDVRVRQAFNYAIDKEALNEAVFAGTADIAKSVVPPAVGGHTEEHFLYDFNPERARELIAEAGLEGSTETIEIMYADIFWHQEPVAIQVAGQLRNHLGLDVQPRRITGSEMRAATAPAEQTLCFFTFEDGPIVLDPVYTMFLLAHSTGVSNRAGFRNAEIDAIIDEARQELDLDTRLALMDEAQRIWIEQAPWILTAYPATYEAMAPNISGWVWHPDEHERWFDLRAD